MGNVYVLREVYKKREDISLSYPIPPTGHVCGTKLEWRETQIGGSAAFRWCCDQCHVAYEDGHICQVCKTGKATLPMVTTVYRSNILGTRRITHCPECRPPTQMSLEFDTLPGAATAKYGLLGCGSILIVGMILAIIVSAVSR